MLCVLPYNSIASRSILRQPRLFTATSKVSSTFTCCCGDRPLPLSYDFFKTCFTLLGLQHILLGTIPICQTSSCTGSALLLSFYDFFGSKRPPLFRNDCSLLTRLHHQPGVCVCVVCTGLVSVLVVVVESPPPARNQIPYVTSLLQFLEVEELSIIPVSHLPSVESLASGLGCFGVDERNAPPRNLTNNI